MKCNCCEFTATTQIVFTQFLILSSGRRKYLDITLDVCSICAIDLVLCKRHSEITRVDSYGHSVYNSMHTSPIPAFKEIQ